MSFLTDHLQQLLKTLPPQPGVYRFMNQEGNVIYVGKARQLNRRVKQYFSNSFKEVKVMAMMQHVTDLSYTITETESDAFLLEATQIKHYKPRYNIILKDDKSYPYLLLSDHGTFPRLDFVRTPKKSKSDGNLYGPYPSLGSAKEALVLLQKVFKLRNCKDGYFNNRTRPCLQYQIDRCSAPCVNKISENNYQKEVHALRDFLSGKEDAALKPLTQMMTQAALSHHYEKAAMIRDHIASLRLLQAQQLISVKKEDCDVLALKIVGRTGYVAMIYVREGQVIHCTIFELFVQANSTPEELLEQFLIQNYLLDSLENRIPPRIIVPCIFENKNNLENIFSERAKRKIRFKFLLNAQDKHYKTMAIRNLEQAIEKKSKSHQVIEERLHGLSQVLGLLKPIKQVECFDISHTQGQDAKAACVIYNQKGHDKSSYRLFNMKGIIPGDDVAAISQAVLRRYTRLLKENLALPDVLLIDGGKAQLHGALKSLAELHIDSILVLGISKGAARKAGMEKIILPNDRLLQISPHDASFHLMQAIRDEAHRFGIKNHRKKRQKNTLHSVLENIEGIGPAKRQSLLSYFGGLSMLQKASVSEIARVPGINEMLAHRIRTYVLGIAKNSHVANQSSED
jgi:excinuclease ABC subunit C